MYLPVALLGHERRRARALLVLSVARGPEHPSDAFYVLQVDAIDIMFSWDAVHH